jgi:hypothetical protein
VDVAASRVLRLRSNRRRPSSLDRTAHGLTERRWTKFMWVGPVDALRGRLRWQLGSRS